MKTFYSVLTIDGRDAELWSDDTYTLHFGNGFEDECESTPSALAAAVSEESLYEIVGTAKDRNDRDKANAAITGGNW